MFCFRRSTMRFGSSYSALLLTTRSTALWLAPYSRDKPSAFPSLCLLSLSLQIAGRSNWWSAGCRLAATAGTYVNASSLFFDELTPIQAEPCMAHAPLDHAEDYSIGVFNLSNEASLRVLAGFLLSMCRKRSGCIAKAKSSLDQNPQYQPWQAGPVSSRLQRRRDRHRAITCWREFIAPVSAAPSDTPPNRDPSNSESPRQSSIGEERCGLRPMPVAIPDTSPNSAEDDAASHHSL